MASNRPCTEDGCEKKIAARGLCPMHYARAKKAGTLGQYGKRTNRADVPCKLDGCAAPGYALGYCQRHYDAYNLYGDPISPAERKRLAGPALCSVGGCDRTAKARGMCGRHHQNETRYGGAVPRKDRPLRERLEEIGWDVTGGGCWEWRGGRTDQGYGVFSSALYGYDRGLAHRAMYEATTGDPTGWVIRHQCDNPPCVNPDHLDVGTHGDNMADMAERGRSAHLWEKHANRCRNGHDVTIPGAVRIVRQRGRKPYRTCAVCDRARKREYDRRRREAASHMPTP